MNKYSQFTNRELREIREAYVTLENYGLLDYNEATELTEEFFERNPRPEEVYPNIAEEV